MKIICYNPQHPKPPFCFYVLSKGLNAGRPSKRSFPNSFAVVLDSEQELMRVFCYAYLLFKADKYSPYLKGSVIPYITIDDFKKLLTETMKSQSINHFKVRFVFSIVVAMKRQQDTAMQKVRLLKEMENSYIRQHIRL
jgi:hypothetical protein